MAIRGRSSSSRGDAGSTCGIGTGGGTGGTISGIGTGSGGSGEGPGERNRGPGVLRRRVRGSKMSGDRAEQRPRQPRGDHAPAHPAHESMVAPAGRRDSQVT